MLPPVAGKCNVRGPRTAGGVAAMASRKRTFAAVGRIRVSGRETQGYCLP